MRDQVMEERLRRIERTVCFGGNTGMCQRSTVGTQRHDGMLAMSEANVADWKRKI
jgi:hypothetical protein